MKVFKKIISSVLASVMCIPSSLFGVAYATESADNGGYAVALMDTDNGIMQFSTSCMEASTATQESYHMVQIGEDGNVIDVENDGSIWVFSNGDNVEIELFPDDGYEVSSFSIKNAETGNILAQEDTTDNVFSFVMPAKNITVEAAFVEIFADNDNDNESYDGYAVEENNIIAENEYGETVYERTELTDGDAVSLQDRINGIPSANEIYYSLYMENDSMSELREEIYGISDAYFYELTDSERAQIDSAPLFAALLTLEASSLAPASGEQPDGRELQELQDRIDALANVYAIAEAEMTEYGDVVFDYGSENGMYIPNEMQDKLFLEVLSLSKEVFSLDSEYLEQLYTEQLEDLYRFFTLGHSLDMNGEIMTLADDDEEEVDYKKGHYQRSVGRNPYKSTYFNGTLTDTLQELTMYCGNASVEAFAHAGGSSISFDSGGNVDEVTPSPTDTDGHNVVRAILYFGFNGPGYLEKKDVGEDPDLWTCYDTSDPKYTTPLLDKMTANNSTIEGMDIVDYMITHFAISSYYSHADGVAESTVGKGAKNFIKFCEEHKDDVPPEFRTFVITPLGKYQPIFYFVMDKEGNPKHAPFNMYFYKLNSQQGYENRTATLAGAEISVKYYAAESNPDGTTDKDSLINSTAEALKSDAVPTATFTFETKQVYPYDSSSGLGSWDFILNAKEIGDSLGLKQVTGVEFAPINTFHEYEEKYKDDNTFWKNQFLTSSPGDYNEFYGGPGTYVIYESRSPQGYDLTGTMMMPMGETYTFETTNLQAGIVVQLWFGEGGTRHLVMPGGSEINGDESGKDTLLLTDQNTMEKVPVELKSGAGAGNIIIEEKPQTIRLWSSAVSLDTGTQWADPDNTGIRLQDDVFVQTFPEKEARYIVDTRLYDKTAGRFVSFNSSNAHSYEGTKVEEIRIPEGFWSVFPNGAVAGMAGDTENGIITTEFNTRTSVEPGQTYEFKVNCSIDGTQNGGLAGHTLVFVNVVTVLNGYLGNIPMGGGAYAPGMGPDVIGYEAALIYQYPTMRMDTDKMVLKLDDNAVDNPGGEDEEETGTNQKEYMSQLETMKQDSAEYIHLTRSQTSILSGQTQRKGGTGESIAYAGMYLDDSFTSGGGAIKQTLTDTIEYANLQPDKTYYVRGYLVDRETGNPAVDANGTPIQNTENTIKQQASSTGKGEWNITYSFDATGCGNRVYVSFVEVYIGDELVLEYKQLNDPLEAFYIPEITTKAWDSKTGTDVTYAEETVKVRDTITYRKLMPGTRYKIESRLVNMETGETLLDVNGSPVIRETTKTITWEDGEITVDFEFPAVIRDAKGDIVKSLAGTIFVAYEKIYIEQGSEGSGRWVLVADHEDFWDENQRIYMPYIDTTALDQKTQEHISYAEKNMKLYDTVHYEAVRPEYTYKLVSELRDVATGGIVVDDAGKKQVITTYFKADFDLQDNQYLTYGDIIPENHDGSGITFDVDAEFFAGRTLVVYERMYLENDYGTGSHLVAEHQQLLDEDQTIHVPKVWTSAIDADTFTKTSFADGSTTIIDTFSYENLIPGFTYELKGYVLDKNQSITTGTNITATGTDGKIAQNSTVFTPESSAGAVRLSFEVDTRKFGTEDYNGMIFVVYEELYVIQRYGGDDARSIVASHTDIADLNQTVYVPRITTNLIDKKTGTKIADAGGSIQLADTINYYRFQPNAGYVIKGKIIDMETGNVLTDNNGKRVEKTVNVTSSDTGTGSWTVDYQFDGTGLAGKIVVAYADVYVRNGERNDILSHVAAHNDFWDDAQRVYIPLISTVATDQKTNSHITYAEENVWITDRISYSFLKPDTEYRLVSRLVDKDTGETVVDDKGISQVIESDFVTTPNESQEKYNQIISNPLTNSSDTGIGYSYGYIIPADGTTLPDGTPYRGVVFTLDAHTFEGRTLVIYEELQIRTQGSSYMTIATHADIMDENQTVHIPKIRTNAVDSETLTHSSKMDGSMTVIDTVKYENLIPGFTYVLEGYLMDKPRDDTKGYGKIKDKDGNYITNRMEFTPDRPDGEVKLSLSGNASEFQTDEGAFSSETLVVFERLYLKNNKDASDDLLIVASHEDINDEKQTIYCPRISTKVVSYDLGEESKDGDADHVIGFTAYECSYCKTRFYTEKETRTHIDSNIKCKNMQAKVNTVTEATIYDRVYYENLIPDRTYSMVGHLIDTKTGKSVLINQRAVQSEEKYFTPGTPNGEVDVVFHVTGIDLAGGRYVVYEELFLDGVSIAEHKDFYDENQTFYVPKLVTSAYDINTGTNIAKNDTKSTIIDEVQISGLKEGQKYYIKSHVYGCCGRVKVY